MTYCDDKLADYEDEDISDILIKLEKSFGLKFERNSFYNVKTFGDLCDVFENRMHHPNSDDCTKQQAFYRVRKAISATRNISEDQIKPDSSLIDLFPRNNRRQKANEFKKYLDTNIKILTCPDWLSLTFLIGLLLSLFAFFLDWKIALSGIVFFISAAKIANHFGKEVELKTVRDLTEKLSRENYVDIRRKKGTINKKEIVQIITDTFSHDLDIDKSDLTRDAKFSWSK
jgi:hypothetical protein